MIRRGRTHWKALQVFGPGLGGPELRKLDATERLVALYRFQNGEAPAEQCFFVPVDEAPGSARGRSKLGDAPKLLRNGVTDPADVDWENFPVLAALEAVTCDELRRFRGLLNADFPPAWPRTVTGFAGIADEKTPTTSDA